jgi:hypothetical protein
MLIQSHTLQRHTMVWGVLRITNIHQLITVIAFLTHCHTFQVFIKREVPKTQANTNSS